MRLVPSSLKKANRDFPKRSQELSSSFLSTFQTVMLSLARSSLLSIKWYPPMIVCMSIVILTLMMQKLSLTLFDFSLLPVAVVGLFSILFLLPWQVLAENEKNKLSPTSQED